MAPTRNGMIPNVHFHKDWQRFVKTWFNQPARKKRRKDKRIAKARRIAPRPLGKLRPIVQCPSFKYNIKPRLGKGFTLAELKAVGICKKEAMNIGISVDYRRKNLSVEGMQRNVQRLKEYKSKLIVFPTNKKKPKKTDSSAEECSKAKQLRSKRIMPIRTAKPTCYARVIKDSERKFSCYKALRKARWNKRTWGQRAKKAKEAAEDALTRKF